LQARIAKKIKALSNIGILLEVYASNKKFKNLFLDIGLMNRVMGIDYNEALNHKNLLAIYRGQLAEQFVGQKFATQTNNQLYYWARDAKNSNAEVDYLLMIDGTVYPVEVKDGPSGNSAVRIFTGKTINLPGRLYFMLEEQVCFKTRRMRIEGSHEGAACLSKVGMGTVLSDIKQNGIRKIILP
jgi:uncharacterized protein